MAVVVTTLLLRRRLLLSLRLQQQQQLLLLDLQHLLLLALGYSETLIERKRIATARSSRSS